MANQEMYKENGIELSKKIIREGSNLEVMYKGLLANSGARKVTAHVGYNSKWEEIQDIPMEMKDGAFKADLEIKLPGTLNITFVDSANNWDNNSGNNYVFKVYEKVERKKAENENTKTRKKQN